MKLGQIILHGERALLIVENEKAVICKTMKARSTLELIINYPQPTVTDKVNALRKEAEVLVECEESELEQLKELRWLPCIDAPEAWAVGVTYKRQALEHDLDIEKTGHIQKDLYSFVYENERAEVFFKGFKRTMRGHNDTVNIRSDSNLTLPEAESVLVLDGEGQILGFTYGNDLTAWDIEKDCPLYLNQAKIWDGSFSIGQYLVPKEKVQSPYSFNLRCLVEREGVRVLESTGSTEGLRRSYEELVYYLTFNNTVPVGTILFTGTACVVDHNFSLLDGDTVIVEKEGVGRLVNKVKKHQHDFKTFLKRV